MSRRSIISFLTVCILLSGPLFIEHGSGSDVTRGELGGYFGSERIYNSSRSLSGGMGSGDLDGDGDVEVAFCDFSGNVIMLDPGEDGSFRAVPIWEQEGPQGTEKGLFDLAVADVLEDTDGPEMLVGGYTGKVYAIYRTGDVWTDEVIYTMPIGKDGKPIRIFQIHVADIDPAAGEEILLGSMLNDQEDPDRYLRYLYRNGSGFASVEIPLPDTVKAIDVGDADPAVEGPEIYVTTSSWNDQGGTDSELLEVFRSGTGWVHRTLFRNDENLIANVRVGDVWSGHPGNELVIAGLSGWCRMLYEVNGTFLRKDIFQAKTSAGESSALEGLAIGDFNPLHDGDEAMVTGYYNEVTQIMEVDGDVIADLAWKTQAANVKLELSGVEVEDVSPNMPGNEVLIASLQGWIEMLHFQDDGLFIELPEETLEIEGSSSVRFDLVIRSEGRVNGDATVSITGGDRADIIYDRFIQLEFGSVLKIPVVISSLSEEERTFELQVNVSSSGLFAEGTVEVHVVPSGGGFTIIVDPSYVTMYDTSGNTFVSRVSLSGAEAYDRIDLSVNNVDGMNVVVDTPLKPGEEANLIVSVDQGFSGSRSITITGSYNNVPISQASLFVNVLKLRDVMNCQLMRDEANNRIIRVYLNASAPVHGLTMTVYLDERTLLKQNVELEGDSYVDLPPVSLEPGDEGDLYIEVTNVAQEQVGVWDLGIVKIEKETEKSRGWEFAVGIVILLIALAVVGLLFLFVKPRQGELEQEASLEGIGGRRKYDYHPQKEEPVRRGRVPRGPERRRAPPSRRPDRRRPIPPPDRRR